MSDLWVLDLGLSDYQKTWAIQKNLQKLRIEKKIPDTLIFCEHQPVITIGKAFAGSSWGDQLQTDDSLRFHGFELIEVDRGGLITAHEPGQWVGYPIFDLNSHEKFCRDVEKFIQFFENSLKKALSVFDLELYTGTQIKAHPEFEKAAVGQRSENRMRSPSGLWWSPRQKCVSLGFHLSRWVSSHGFAINALNSAEIFKEFTPCGFDSIEVVPLRSKSKSPSGLTHSGFQGAFLAELKSELGLNPTRKKLDDVVKLSKI